MRALVAWRGGLFLKEGKIGVLSVVFSIFNAGGSVCGCMCVYTHTHTHTTQMGYLDVSPGVRKGHLEARRIQMDYISSYIYSYMCTKYTCVHIYTKRRDEILD